LAALTTAGFGSAEAFAASATLTRRQLRNCMDLTTYLHPIWPVVCIGFDQRGGYVVVTRAQNLLWLAVPHACLKVLRPNLIAAGFEEIPV